LPVDRDRDTDLEQRSGLVRVLARSRSEHVLIEEAGHMMPVIHPDTLTAAILAHLKTVT
jgi:pimeloyl-ACP methyl ester carboxylesterase